MKSNNVIEINGKVYDARSGMPLHKPAAKPVPSKAAPSTAKPVKYRAAPRSVDGLSRHPGSQKPKHAPAKSAPAKKPEPAKIPVRSSSPSARLKAKRSTTLNRSVVGKPQISATSLQVESPAPAKSTAASNKEISSSAILHADTARLKRAQGVAKSDAISRFGNNTYSAKHTAPLTEHLSATHETKAAAKTTKKPVEKLSTKEQLIKKAIDHAATPAHHPPTHNSGVKKTRKKGRLAGYTSTAVAALLLAGYVAYLNVPSISMKVAANRAGFAATMPAYKPAGYSLRSPIAYSPGQVVLDFKSNTDDREFKLKQQPTTWDTTALLENHVAKQSPHYLTYQDRGLTIFIYGDGDAAWVNGGKMYQVESGNSHLDTEQLLKLATSV